MWQRSAQGTISADPEGCILQATGVPHDGQSNGYVTALSTAGHEHAQQQVQGAPEAGPSEDSDRTQQASTQQVTCAALTGVVNSLHVACGLRRASGLSGSV